MTTQDALTDLELLEVSALIRDREVSPLALTQALLARIAALDPALNSYVVVTADSALAQAATAEAEIAAGRWRGPLHGVPLGVKDLFWTVEAPTAAGMPLRRDAWSGDDATVVRRLKAAGAVILGKQQLTEGAYADHHPTVAPPVNPWNPDYWTGISSSGPGVAVAAGLCFGALGSDTGGSIRWPSSANGVTGLKPTWGRVSRHGAVELAASLDHVGPMARSAADLAVLMQAIAGHDPADPTSRAEPVPAYAAEIAGGVRGLRIGIDPRWNASGADPEVSGMMAEAAATFEALGARLVEVAFPNTTEAVADWALICAVEAAVAHAGTFPSQREAYGPVLAAVLDRGRQASATAYQEALLRRMAARGAVSALFRDIDLLLTPVQPFAPLTLATVRTLGEQPELIEGLQRFTGVFDLTGHPALTLPAGASPGGLPMAVQLVGSDLAEATLLRAGVAFQSATNWHRRRPGALAKAA
ncbi:amidase [Caulobacter mirabilis]|uniref:Asp-tRNA(Asn)/Glu-tRNA(Gln) amidotransferase GatCAB subunit A n=1 Tax=Caulobacter mirabilis TaxID=69666 RepID=A0A2D2AWZ4_9CAUL|nr:amidase [Caulobacter mirabilis]ATQ42524.1 Asp-tRNA(Asn)/Glu-tRNA(Gln) amidotransferase GatCAB subunit A [Caulobacter mirabilis]